jgi:membrane protease YdiL (CAAX protease family)
VDGKVHSGGRRFDRAGKAVFQHRVLITTAYLILVGAAELLTVYVAAYGIALHAVILFTLSIHSALTISLDPDFSGFLAVLIIAPLIRILSLSTPLVQFSYITWFAIISIPVYIAIFTCVYIQNLKPDDIALARPKVKHIPLELGAILIAVPFGIAEYFILKPGALVAPRVEALIIPSLVMILCTGLLEELAFRGLMQYHATRTMGFSGIIFTSVLFGVLHIGNLTIFDVVLAGSVGFIYSLVVQKTGSLYGISVSHGIINIILFLIAPSYF